MGIALATTGRRHAKSLVALSDSTQDRSNIGPLVQHDPRRKVRHGAATEISGSRSARGRPEEVMPVEQLTPDSDIYSWTEAA